MWAAHHASPLMSVKRVDVPGRGSSPSMSVKRVDVPGRGSSPSSMRTSHTRHLPARQRLFRAQTPACAARAVHHSVIRECSQRRFVHAAVR